MNTLLTVILVQAGLLLGTLLFARLGRWLHALGVAPSEPRARKRLGQMVIVSITHSGPWLLAALSSWAYWVLSKPHDTNWNWFFGSIVLALPVWGAFTIVLLRRARRENVSDDHA